MQLLNTKINFAMLLLLGQVRYGPIEMHFPRISLVLYQAKLKSSYTSSFFNIPRKSIRLISIPNTHLFTSYTYHLSSVPSWHQHSLRITLTVEELDDGKTTDIGLASTRMAKELEDKRKQLPIMAAIMPRRLNMKSRQTKLLPILHMEVSQLDRESSSTLCHHLY